VECLRRKRAGREPADCQVVPSQENRPAREKPMLAVRRSDARLPVMMYMKG
jgi:hypothetical protein